MVVVVTVNQSLVRTFTGAWIETLASLLNARPLEFAPSRVRGLKPYALDYRQKARVRTFTGAWIETARERWHESCHGVRTFTGAWIETWSNSIQEEIAKFAPSRVRGLKLPPTPALAPPAVRTFTGAWIETVSSSPAKSGS